MTRPSGRRGPPRSRSIHAERPPEGLVATVARERPYVVEIWKARFMGISSEEMRAITRDGECYCDPTAMKLFTNQ